MYRDMRGEENEHSNGKEGVEIGRRNPGDLNESHEKEPVHQKQERDTDEAPLLGECGEDEVSLIFRKKPQLGLCTVADTLAEEFAGADCDFRLVRVVA